MTWASRPTYGSAKFAVGRRSTEKAGPLWSEANHSRTKCTSDQIEQELLQLSTRCCVDKRWQIKVFAASKSVGCTETISQEPRYTAASYSFFEPFIWLRTLGLENALLQVVWRSPGGHTDASFVVGGREIDLKMSNLDGFGQFKAQTSAKVLLRP